MIIPASNEEGYIRPCLAALYASACPDAEVIVVANGCRDRTAGVARDTAADAAATGWELRVIERAEGAKPPLFITDYDQPCPLISDKPL